MTQWVENEARSKNARRGDATGNVSSENEGALGDIRRVIGGRIHVMQ